MKISGCFAAKSTALGLIGVVPGVNRSEQLLVWISIPLDSNEGSLAVLKGERCIKSIIMKEGSE